MASTYSNLGIELIGTGEQAGTWGTTTNGNFSNIIDNAIVGYASVTAVAASTTLGTPALLTVSDGAASSGQKRIIEITSASDLGASSYLSISPNDFAGYYFIKNSLLGSRSLIVFQGTWNGTDPNRAVTIENGYEAVIRCNGGGAGAVVSFINYNIKTGSIYASKTGGATVLVQVEGEGSTQLRASRSSTDTVQPLVTLTKSRGTIAAKTIVASGDVLGEVSFWGYDGTQIVSAASISTTVDATPGVNDMPGALILGTTADGASAPTERMRISNAGNVGIGTTSPTQKLDINGNAAISGNVGIGTTSPTQKLDVNGATRLNGEVGVGSAPSASYKLYVDSGAIGGVYSTTTGLIPAYFRSTDTSSGGLSIFFEKDSASPAASDDIANLRFRGNNSVSAITEYVRLSATIADPTNASEDGTLSLTTMKAGVLAERVRYSSADGFYIVDGTFRAPDVYAFNVGATFRSAYINSTGQFGGLTSSIRYKENIEESAYGLDELMQLRSVTFNYKSDPTSARSLGFIAEEVDAIGLRELVSYNEENKPETVHYELMTALLTKAIQEQQAMIEDLKARVAALGG